jgi:A/G-specific adenine glycosylase
MAENPTLEIAAQRNAGDLRTLLAPLGLSWRIENIIAFIKVAHERHGSDVPTDAGELLALPGVGDYVAAAVGCFAATSSAPLIDTNVVRVVGRFLGVDVRGEARRRRSFREFAASLVPASRAQDYHYALLDFAALVCVARRPRCPACPLMSRCHYAKEQRESHVRLEGD